MSYFNINSKLKILIISIFIGFSCKTNEVEINGSIEGIVTDALTSQLLSGVTISLSPNNISKTTGIDGKYQFTNLEQGDYSIQTSKNGYQSNTKILTVLANQIRKGDITLNPILPSLGISVNTLDFGSELTTLSIQINNTGSGQLEWSVSENIDWLSAAPIQGSCTTQSSQLAINVNRSGLNEGSYSQIISVISNGGNKTLIINIKVKSPELPTVSCNNPINVSSSAADVSANILILGSSQILEHGHCWSSSSNSPTINDQKTSLGIFSSGQSYVSNITNLLPNTTYFLRAYLTNNFGAAYSEVVSFTTLALPKAPRVSTSDAWNVSDHSVVIEGSITDLGNSNIIEHGHCISTKSNPTINDIITTLGIKNVTGTFASSFSNLVSETTYYVRSYAKNNAGIVYGEEKIFFTTLKGKGQQVFYFDKPFKEAKVFINGKYVGTIGLHYYPTSTPDCFEEGLVTVCLPPGTYNFLCNSTDAHRWESTITILENMCIKMRLNL